MFSRIAKQRQDMAFAPYKHHLARAAGLAYAEETLCAFMDGRERAYAVEDVIRELRALFGGAGALPIAAIRKGMNSLDEEERSFLFHLALDMLGKSTRGDHL